MGVTKVEIVPIRPQDGLMGFASIELDHKFYISSIGVHKRLGGTGYRITYPTRKVGQHNLAVCHPTQLDLSKEIERIICEKAIALFGE